MSKQKILFIGNSYTYYNDMPAMFEQLANANGKDVKVYSVTFGGAKLHQYVDEKNEYAERIEELIQSHRFDFCVLQEQSFLPIVDYGLFEKGAKALADKLGASVSKFVLYATWGRKDGSETLREFGWTHEGMTCALADAYEKVSKIIHAEVAPVGHKFHEIYRNHEEIELYDADLTHPSYKGSCLAMITLYKTIFGEVPQTMDTMNLTEDEKVLLYLP